MKTSLTQKEKDLMPIIAKKWIEKAITPTNRNIEIIQKNMEQLYEMSNLEKVPVIVCESLNEFSQRISQFIKESSVGSSVWSSVGLYYWVNDLSCYDYWKTIGVFTDPETITRNEILIDLLSDCSYGFITDKICIVLTKPKVEVNDRYFIHSDIKMALEWKDGQGEYFLNGVKFPQELWSKVVSKEMTIKEIMAIDDIDQRTQAMKYAPIEELLSLGKEVDTYKKHTLDGQEVNYRLIRFDDLFPVKAWYAVYNCPSTQKLYMSGIDPEIGAKEDIKLAMAWKSQIQVEDFINSIPLVHES